MADSIWATAGVTYEIDHKPQAESPVFDPAYAEISNNVQGK